MLKTIPASKTSFWGCPRVPCGHPTPSELGDPATYRRSLRRKKRILYTSGSQKELIFLIFMKNHDFYHFSRLLSGLEVPDRAHIAPGSVLKPLQNDSPQQGDELLKKSHRKTLFFSGRKYFQKKLKKK